MDLVGEPQLSIHPQTTPLLKETKIKEKCSPVVSEK